MITNPELMLELETFIRHGVVWAESQPTPEGVFHATTWLQRAIRDMVDGDLGKHLAETRSAQLRALYAEGWTPTELAKLSGLSRRRIYQIIER